MHRRNLFRLAGSLPALAGFSALAATPQRIVAIVEPGNSVAASAPVAWALDQLRQALQTQGSSLETVAAGAAAGATLALILAAPGAALAAGFPSARRTA